MRGGGVGRHGMNGMYMYIQYMIALRRNKKFLAEEGSCLHAAKRGKGGGGAD